MNCRRCPHHVRHGFAREDGVLEFTDLCGLKIKQNMANDKSRKPVQAFAAGKKPSAQKAQAFWKAKIRQHAPDEHCDQLPFKSDFEYIRCSTYVVVFKATDKKNDVVPTQDLSYGDIGLSGSGLSDLDIF